MRGAARAAGAAGCFLLAMASAAGGCVSGQTRIGEVFGGSWREQGRSVVLLEERLRAVPIAPGADVAVGVTDEGLVGLPLSGGSTWTFGHALSGRPSIAGSVVVGAGGGELFALRASNGELLWRRPSGGFQLVGAGDDGAITVATLESSSGEGAVLLAVDRDGQVVRQLESEKRLGRPAIIAGLAFIPWADRFVTAYDTVTGEEVARLSLGASVTAAFTLSGSLFFADAGVARFDESLVASPGRAKVIEMPDREPFGALRMVLRQGERAAPIAGPADKIRGYARPTPRGSPLAFEGDRFVATYYRVVASMRAENGALKWVRGLDSDVVGAALFDGGVALCDLAGRVVLLEEGSGQEAAQLALGQPVRSCVVQADGLARQPSGKPAPPLADQIAEVLTLASPDLAPAQAWLLDQLGALADPAATRVLVELSLDPETVPQLLPRVHDKLAARRTGAEHMLRALGSTQDFLRDVPRPPPVAPLAQALAAMGERRAAPLLVRHLLHPATPPEGVRAAAAALSDLATAAELDELEQFFAFYRCEARSEPMIEAVVFVAHTIAKLGGAAGSDLLARAAADPLTVPQVKGPLARITAGVKPSPEPSLIPAGNTGRAGQAGQAGAGKRATSR